MQAEAAQKFGFTPRRTMSVAQKLYEGVEVGSEGQVGLITYMRTDSVRIAPEGLTRARRLSQRKFQQRVSSAARAHLSYEKGCPGMLMKP